MKLCAVCFLLCFLSAPVWAADSDAFPDLNVTDPASLQEASRVLEEELKLAGGPQTYVLIDLVTQSIQIKGRGIELHRIAIERWGATSISAMPITFRLLARPAVVRRKLDPNHTVTQEPISISDMPVQYTLSCAPALIVEVVPAASDHPFLWFLSSSRMSWRRLQAWGSAWLTGAGGPPEPSLMLTLAAEQAQAFAWSLVDGMSFVIRRPSAL
jgi:hypothetical protein